MTKPIKTWYCIFSFVSHSSVSETACIKIFNNLALHIQNFNKWIYSKNIIFSTYFSLPLIFHHFRANNLILVKLYKSLLFTNENRRICLLFNFLIYYLVSPYSKNEEKLYNIFIVMFIPMFLFERHFIKTFILFSSIYCDDKLTFYFLVKIV